MGIEEFYAAATPEQTQADTAPQNDDLFAQLDVDSVSPLSDEWDDTASPLRHLFKKDGRGRLVEYAAEQVPTGTPIYMNKSELADNADVSRHSVIRHMDLFIEWGIYEGYDKESRERYRPNEHSYALRIVAAANKELSETPALSPQDE